MTDVTAIIFVIACSSFNMVIREDEKTVSYDTCMEGCAGYNVGSTPTMYVLPLGTLKPPPPLQ